MRRRPISNETNSRRSRRFSNYVSPLQSQKFHWQWNERRPRGKWKNAALQKGYTNHNDCMPHKEYVAWQRDCLKQMMRVIPEDGAIFYNHKWRVQGGLLQDRQDIVGDFPVRQVIIWKRKGGLNFNSGYFLPTYEVIYLIAKPNFELVDKANAHGDVW